MNQYANVGFVSSEILLIRSAFNMAAMFTDPSMYRQASAMVSASGPFAPLATFALMVAWAVAESVVDTANIMSGQKVLLYKQGKDWEISAQGAIKNAVGAAFDVAASAAESAAQSVSNEIETKVNSAIYDYYEQSGNLSTQLDKVSAITQEASGSGGLMQDANTLVNGVKDGVSTSDKYMKEFENQKDASIAKISESYKYKKEQMKNNISSNAQSYFPNPERAFSTGDSKADPDFAVKLGYTDYLRLLLLLEDSDQKMQRVQQVIQINMRKGGGEPGFTMSKAMVNVWADAKCSIKYLFMTEAFVPSEMRKDGRFTFTIHTNRSY